MLIRRKQIIQWTCMAWLLLVLIHSAQEYIFTHYIGRGQSVGRILAGVLPHYVMWAALAVAIVWTGLKFPITRSNWPFRLPLHFAFSLVVYFIDISLSIAVLPMLLHDSQLTRFAMTAGAIRTYYDDFVLYWLILGLTHLFRISEEFRTEQRKSIELQHQLAEVQLGALRAQLQPHFLFNTLNSISSLMHANVEQADLMLTSLSDLLRFSLRNTSAQLIPLRTELESAELYLRIQRIRFSDSFEARVDVDSTLLETEVPTLILQPLIENSFRHGIGKHKGTGHLELTVQRDAETLVLAVRDDGPGCDAREVRHGIGLGNTLSRLRQLYGDAFSFNASNAPGGGFVTRIAIPLRMTTAA